MSEHSPSNERTIAALIKNAANSLSCGCSREAVFDELMAIADRVGAAHEPPADDTGRYCVAVNHCGFCNTDFSVWDGHWHGTVTPEAAEALQTRLNRAAQPPEPSRLTGPQCDEIISALASHGWTGFSREDIRLIATTIEFYRASPTKGDSQ